MRTGLILAILAACACSASLNAQLEPRGYFRFPAGGEALPVLAAPDSQAQPIGTLPEGGHAVLEQRACFDGMSDIPHGWSLQLILAGSALEEEPRLLTGCCRVLPSR